MPKSISKFILIGTTISVYNREIWQTAIDIYHEAGEKLYELIWKSDRFEPTADVRTQANTCTSTIK